MDSEKFLVAAGLTAAAVVGAFVFWGPTTGPGHTRGRLAGLINLGQTCFLNTILQALAACPQFINWLHLDVSIKDDSLRCTLVTVLSVINGTHISIDQGTFAPAEVMNALRRLGWAIPTGEQDAHELFHVLLTSLDEETPKLSRLSGCLSDALGLDSIDSTDPDSDTSDSFDIDASTSMLSLSDLTSSITSENGHIGRPKSLKWRSGLNRRHRWISRSCRSLRLSGPAPPQVVAHPFCGTLTSQLKCTDCGYKSAVRYDKFDSISLALPSGMGDLGWGRHKLHQLLTNFTTAEVVNDVLCEGCNRNRDSSLPPLRSKQLKIQQFGKLPACLCIHISRNIWHASGKVSKRQDYVQFPIRLSLSAYTFLQAQFLTRVSMKKFPEPADIQTSRNPKIFMLTPTFINYFSSTSEGGSPLSYSMPSTWGGSQLTENNQEWRHLYQLAAVVVHIGDAYSGHFATYRRGHHTSTTKWFFTSDVEIREATMDEVLRSTAYMLFYEKCSPIGSF